MILYVSTDASICLHIVLICSEFKHNIPEFLHFSIVEFGMLNSMHKLLHGDKIRL